MATLDAVKLLARKVAARSRGTGATDDDAMFLDVNFDLIPRKARQFSGEHELARRLVQINGRSPARCVSADQLSDLVVQREQIRQRIPPCKRHGFAS